MPDPDPPIVINGGSVTIEFDEQTYPGGNGRYHNAQRKITRVEVIDDDTGQAQEVQIPASGRCVLRVYTK